MLFEAAQVILQRFLSPLTLDEFLDRTLTHGAKSVPGTGAGLASNARTELLGADPQQRLLEAVHLAPKLTFHSANPLGPAPSLQAIRDSEDYRERIELFHTRNFSVRFPELRPLSPALDRICRAIEILLHKPVTASAFWSRGGMRAPVHHDDHDLIVVQLRGTKRWYVANNPADLTNTWPNIPGGPPRLDAHTALDLRPGDLLFLPRGTLHTVDCETESLHISIGFTPLTLREMLIAAIDHLSDLDRTLRTTVGGRLGFQLLSSQFEPLAPTVMDGLARVVSACRTPGFLSAALQRRSARAVAGLPPLTPPETQPAMDLNTELTQADTAFCHLTSSPQTIDFAYPGGHLYIHSGAADSLLYMADTLKFRVRDIPGGIDDEVRLSLANSLVGLGYLRVSP